MSGTRAQREAAAEAKEEAREARAEERREARAEEKAAVEEAAAVAEKEAHAVTVSGDADGGWIVEVHDGDRHEVYSPKAKTEDGAAKEALKLFAKAAKEA